MSSFLEAELPFLSVFVLEKWLMDDYIRISVIRILFAGFIDKYTYQWSINACIVVITTKQISRLCEKQ